MDEQRLQPEQEHGPEERAAPAETRPARAPGRVPRWAASDAVAPGLFAEGEGPAPQRKAALGAEALQPAEGEAGAELTPPTPAPAGLLVPDEAEGEPGVGRMRKSAFLALLRAETCATAEAALAGTIWEAAGCPYIDRWFAYYAGRDAGQIERALHRFAPETAGASTAGEYVPLACARLRRGIEAWVATGSLAEVPEGAALLPAGAEGAGDGAGPGVQPKAGAGGAMAASPAAVGARLGPGQPLDGGVRGRMEGALGADLSGVRVHTDARAAGLAQGLRSRAFTVGNHVAFAGGEYRPGSPVGDALIAHELAHVAQQRAGAGQAAASYGALEEDADQAAVGAALRLWGGARELAGRTMPALRSGLRLQSCGMSAREKQQGVDDLAAIVSNPLDNEAAIIKKIDDFGGDAAAILMHVGPFSDKVSDAQLRTYAGTEAGQRVLVRVSGALRDGDLRARMRADTIDKILASFKPAAAPGVKPEDQVAIDRINKAIEADPRKAEYARGPLALRLPVTLRPFGSELFGGVYYNPHMAAGAKSGDAGRTHTETFTSQKTGKVSYMLVYIELGPLALGHTDEKIRSVMWHEFIHYRQKLRFREPEASKSAETRVLEAELKAGGDAPNAELEATSTQLADYFDRLNDDEVGSILRYLADHFAHPSAQQSFKQAAIDRVRAAVAGDRAKQDRLLKVIKAQSAADEKALADLTAAIRASLAPPAKKKGKR